MLGLFGAISIVNWFHSWTLWFTAQSPAGTQRVRGSDLKSKTWAHCICRFLLTNRNFGSTNAVNSAVCEVRLPSCNVGTLAFCEYNVGVFHDKKACGLVSRRVFSECSSSRSASQHIINHWRGDGSVRRGGCQRQSPSEER